MTDTALDLVERVLPVGVPVRQWVCSLPWRLRALCGYDRGLCADVVRAFVLEVSRSLRSRAKRALGLRSLKQAHTGAVAFIQRFDSALRLNVHAHVLFLDGVYVREGDPESGPLIALGSSDCAAIWRLVARVSSPRGRSGARRACPQPRRS